MSNEIVKINPSELSPEELFERVRDLPILKINGKPLPAASHPWGTLTTRYDVDRSRVTAENSLATATEVLFGLPIEPVAVPWWWLRRSHTQLLRGRLAKRYAHTTANKILSFVRQMLDECFDAELMTSDDYTRARRGAKSIKGSREIAGRYLEKSERDRIKAACPTDTPIGVRDGAAVCVVDQTGLRRDECTRLNRANYDMATQLLCIIGKGNKQRKVHANGPLRDALRAWLALRGDAPGPLFYAATPGGAIIDGRRLSYSGLQAAVLERARQAGVKDVSMHDFRRSLVSDLFDEGVDIATISKIVGHSDPKTTAKYDRRGERAAAEALERHGKIIEDGPTGQKMLQSANEADNNGSGDNDAER
jgi:integrase/recombinase XerD